MLNFKKNHSSEKEVLTTDGSGRINSFRIQRTKELVRFENNGRQKIHRGACYTVCVLPGCIISGSKNSNIRFWKVLGRNERKSKGKGFFDFVSPKGEILNCHEDGKPIEEIRYSHKHNIFASSSCDSNIKIWDTHKKVLDGSSKSFSNEPLAVLRKHVKCACTIDYCLPNNYLCSGSEDRSLCVWDLEKLKLNFQIVDSAKRAVAGIATEKERDCVYTGNLDQTVRCFDLRENFLHKPRYNKHAAKCNSGKEIWSICMTSDQNYILTGTSNGKSQIFDKRKLENYVTEKKFIHYHLFSSFSIGDGEMIQVGGGGTLYLRWDGTMLTKEGIDLASNSVFQRVLGGCFVSRREFWDFEISKKINEDEEERILYLTSFSFPFRIQISSSSSSSLIQIPHFLMVV